MVLDDVKKLAEETLQEIKLELKENPLTKEEIEIFLSTPKNILEDLLEKFK